MNGVCLDDDDGGGEDGGDYDIKTVTGKVKTWTDW